MIIKTPFYKLDNNIKEIVSKSVVHVRDVGLDNFSFEYMKNHEFYEVHLSEYKLYWQMAIIKKDVLEYRDFYKVSFDGIIEYDFSEDN